MHKSSHARIASVLNQLKKENQDEILDPRWKGAPKTARPKSLDPEVLVKQKLLQNIGHVSPMIRNGVEKALDNVIYKRKNYFEVSDQFVNRIDREVNQLINSRRLILGVIFDFFACLYAEPLA